MPQWEDEYANEMENNALNSIKEFESKKQKVNKMTPVQWLYDQIGDNAPYEYAAQIASYLEEAMKMEQSQAMTLQTESKSKAIPELSDDEIEKAFTVGSGFQKTVYSDRIDGAKLNN